MVEFVECVPRAKICLRVVAGMHRIVVAMCLHRREGRVYYVLVDSTLLLKIIVLCESLLILGKVRLGIVLQRHAVMIAIFAIQFIANTGWNTCGKDIDMNKSFHYMKETL
jgi:hypothetical protein